MKKFLRLVSLAAIFIGGAFGMNQEEYVIKYHYQNLPFDVTETFNDDMINIRNLTSGTEAQKLEAMNAVYNQHNTNLLDRIFNTTDVIYYIMALPYVGPNYIGSNNSQQFEVYEFNDSQGNDLTESIAGMIPQNFLEQKLSEIKSQVSDNRDILNFISNLKSRLVDNYAFNNNTESVDEIIQAVQDEADLPELAFADELNHEIMAINLITVLHQVKRAKQTA